MRTRSAEKHNLEVRQVSAGTSLKIANAGFLAALMVIFIHVDMQPDCPAVVRWFVGIVEQGLCTVAVPAFFVISGYLLGGHVGEAGWWGRAVRKRLVTLGVPYFLWGTLFFFFDYFRSHDASLLGLLKSLGLTTCETPGLYPLWFVRSLFLLVCVSPVLVWLLSRVGKKLLVGLFALALLGPLVVKMDVLALRLAGLFAAFGGMFYFTVGLAARFFGKVGPVSDWLLRWTGLIGLALTVSGAVGELCGMTYAHKYCVVLGLPLLMAGLWRIVPATRWPGWLTSCAFPVFILHVFAIGVYNNFLVREVNGLLAFCAKYVFAVVLPIVVVIVARRIAPRLVKFAFGGRC